MRYAYLVMCVFVHGAFSPTYLHAGLIFFGPSAYLSPSNVPVGFYSGSATIETLEDASFSFGISAVGGNILGPSFFTDSVDSDDGIVNNVGAGHSYFSSNGSAGVTFTFNHSQLPTAAGLVWTDGLGQVTFEVFGAGMVSLGKLGPLTVPIGSHAGSTFEDRFYGAHYDGGIMAIKLSNSEGGIEVDHIQFGTIAAVPEPSTAILVCAGILLGTLRRFRLNVWQHT